MQKSKTKAKLGVKNQAKSVKFKVQSQVQNSKPKLEVKYRAFYLSMGVIKFVEDLPNRPALWTIRDQPVRCVTPIGANIVEAKASASKREFARYFQIALKSANETNKQKEIEAFIEEAGEISKIIGSSILTMKGKRRL